MYSIKIEGLDRLVRDFNKAPDIITKELTKATSDSVILAKNVMKTEAPYKTGDLRRSITGIHWGVRGEIKPNVAYAGYIEKGTPRHVIEPVNKKALYWKGAMHPVKRVHHPGTKANPFVQRTYEQSAPRIQQKYDEAMKRIVAALAGK
jgi:hypothetical protein